MFDKFTNWLRPVGPTSAGKTVRMYTPPLSGLLRLAEKTHGRELTREEVEAIARGAERIEVPLNVARQVNGYEPVTPETAWDYWRQSKTPRVNPRHVICALGTWNNFDEIKSITSSSPYRLNFDADYSTLAANPNMMRAFTVNQDRLPPSMTQDDWDAVEAHSAVAYILSPETTPVNAVAVSGGCLELIQKLFAAGATAIQSESSGLAHGKAKWMTLADNYRSAILSQNDFEAGISLYNAFVQKGIVDDDTIVYSIGMHLLGHRDLEYQKHGERPLIEMEWINLLGYYITGDRPDRPILEGDGFRLNPKSGRRTISLTECERYEPDSFQYNPYGYYRLGPET